MNYVITLTASNFSRQLDEVSAINLASVSGLFASFILSIRIVLLLQGKQYVVSKLTGPFHGNALICFVVYFLGLVSV